MNELFSVRDKTVMITGGSSGLGLQLVHLFMHRGARVCSIATQHDPRVCILANKAMSGSSVYSATKAGVAQMTRSMAHELGPLGIRVNAIAPGWFETRMTAGILSDPAKTYLKGVNPLRRLGQPGDLDGAALLLASEAGRYINGTVITVDGGQSLSG